MKNIHTSNIKQNLKHCSNGFLPDFQTKFRNSFDQTFINDFDDFSAHKDNHHQYTHSSTLGGNNGIRNLCRSGMTSTFKPISP